jgi:DNA-binding NtrC family response regulator
LDELGELPLELQPKLLRVLGEREVRRVGGSKTRGIDVRIVAATNRDLRRDVNAGRFRGDLFYRLAVVQVQMPPLRERFGDLPLLVAELLNAISPGVAPPEDLDIEHLMRHSWPGNVRELRNYLEQILVLRSLPPLDPSDAREEESLAGLDQLPLHAAMDRFERQYLANLLRSAAGNVAEAARRAGVNRATLFRLINKYGLRER